MRRAGILAAASAACLLAACTATPEQPAALAEPTGFPPALAEFYTQEVAWVSCGGDFQCGQLRVPVDYGSPGAGEVRIELVRLPAGGDRIGSLVVNPGGPGGSGVTYARAAQGIVSEAVLSVYDIVGFDPRGVARSQPVECLDDEQTDALLAADPTPDSDEEVQQLIDAAATVGRGCLEQSPQIAPWMDTVSVANDMDILRAALGERDLDFLGKSFGTAIGSVYAERFPDRVGRMVLDGAFPLSLSGEQISKEQAVGFEGALLRFAADCIERPDCPLDAASAPDAAAEVGRFLASLEAAPVPAGDGRELTEALGSAAVLYHLYFPPGDWALLREGLAAAQSGDGSLLLRMLDDRLDRDPATGAFATNAQEAFYAVSCLDRPAGSLADIEARAGQWASAAPTFGPYLAWSDAVCAQWPVPAVSAPRTIAAAGAAPVLVVSTQYDPATPYGWGVRMAQEFDAAALVSYNGDGHTGYRNGSDCVDEAVDAYLIDATVPAADPRCGY